MDIQLQIPQSLVRVLFGQTKDGYVTASLRHSIGPLIVGESVMMYEVDGDELLYAVGHVEKFDAERGVAYLSVRRTEIQVAPAPSDSDVERPTADDTPADAPDTEVVVEASRLLSV